MCFHGVCRGKRHPLTIWSVEVHLERTARKCYVLFRPHFHFMPFIVSACMHVRADREHCGPVRGAMHWRHRIDTAIFSQHFHSTCPAHPVTPCGAQCVCVCQTRASMIRVNYPRRKPAVQGGPSAPLIAFLVIVVSVSPTLGLANNPHTQSSSRFASTPARASDERD